MSEVTLTTPTATERYFYRSLAEAPGHRRSASAYLVEHIAGSTVVARIEPLGLISTSMSETELVLTGLRRNLVLRGPWVRTSRARHVRVRVVSI